MPADPDQLVDLTTASNEMHAAIIAAALKDRGIPAVPVGTAGSVLQWEIAATAPFRVQVRRRDVEAAHAVLAELKQDSIDIDWSELEAQGAFGAASADDADFGRSAETVVCARCGYDRRGLKARAACPECGEIEVRTEPAKSDQRRRSAITFAIIIASIVLLSLYFHGQLPF